MAGVRITIRLDSKERELVERAAAVAGISASRVVRRGAVDEARLVLAEAAEKGLVSDAEAVPRSDGL